MSNHSAVTHSGFISSSKTQETTSNLRLKPICALGRALKKVEITQWQKKVRRRKDN